MSWAPSEAAINHRLAILLSSNTKTRSTSRAAAKPTCSIHQAWTTWEPSAIRWAQQYRKKAGQVSARIQARVNCHQHSRTSCMHLLNLASDRKVRSKLKSEKKLQRSKRKKDPGQTWWARARRISLRRSIKVIRFKCTRIHTLAGVITRMSKILTTIRPTYKKMQRRIIKPPVLSIFLKSSRRIWLNRWSCTLRAIASVARAASIVCAWAKKPRVWSTALRNSYRTNDWFNWTMRTRTKSKWSSKTQRAKHMKASKWGHTIRSRMQFSLPNSNQKGKDRTTNCCKTRSLRTATSWTHRRCLTRSLKPRKW